MSRTCDQVPPSLLYANTYTHIKLVFISNPELSLIFL
jgi:hypothetical protein